MEKHYGLQDKQLEVQVSYLCIVWVWDYEQYKSETDKYKYENISSMDLRLWVV